MRILVGGGAGRGEVEACTSDTFAGWIKAWVNNVKF